MERKTYLNIGCGEKKLPGFINIDIEPGADIRADLRDGLPLRSSSVQGIFSEHFIEHLTQCEGLNFLRECRRVLEPGGILRVATPDLDVLVQDYIHDRLQPDWDKHGYDWIDNPCEMLNLAMREWGHQWIYNEDELTRIARMAGLSFLKRCEWGRSDLQAFNNLEYREGSNLILEFSYRRLPRAEEEQPLVSVLIPSYNPRYFRESLNSALKQTYRNLEIIVSDDCPGEEIGAIVTEYTSPDSRITYIRNQPSLGDITNHLQCFEKAGGEYIKFLNDDDMLHPECIERMVRCLNRYPDVTLVTSHRQCIDGKGDPMPDFVATLRPVGDDSLIEGISVARRVLTAAVNFIGEPTTALFRKRDIEGVRPTIMSLGGSPINMNSDVAMWLNLLSAGDMIYLVATLSYFRLHAEQRQRKPDAYSAGTAAWQQMRQIGERLGLWSRGGDAELKARPLDIRSQWSAEVLQLLEQANSHLADRNLEATKEALLTASTLAPTDPWLVVTHGNVLMQEGNLEGARQQYTKATILHPEYPLAYLNLGLVSLQLERLGESEDALRKAVALFPDNLDGWRILGQVLITKGQFDEGLQILRSVLRQRPEDIESLLLIGQCCAEAGLEDEARAMYRKALQIEPKSAIARANLDELGKSSPSSQLENPTNVSSDI